MSKDNKHNKLHHPFLIYTFLNIYNNMTKIISELGEKELIQILLDKRDEMLPPTHQIIHESYSDDAALLFNKSRYTVVSTDMLIQHTHFPRSMTKYQMGKKAVTVNISDIIAMNATPTAILVSMALPPHMSLDEYLQLVNGILDACQEYDIKLIGGDINQNDEIILSGTSMGEIDENIKLQSNIKENNLIAVTGELGTPAAALDLIKNHEEDPEIVKTLLEPELPIESFKKIRKQSDMITSLTDITDGLASELGQLKKKNTKIGFEIIYEKLPYNHRIKKIADDNHKSLEEYLLHFGEDFQLLLTLDEKKYAKNPIKELHIIGKTNNTGKITIKKNGKTEKLNIDGYEHLKN